MSGARIFLRAFLVYLLCGLALHQRGLPLIWLLWGVLVVEALCGALYLKARLRHHPMADVLQVLTGTSPFVICATGAALIAIAGASPVHYLTPAGCIAASLVLSQLELRQFRLKPERSALRRAKVIQEAEGVTYIRTGTLRFATMNKTSRLTQWLGIGVPLFGFLLILPMAPGRWGADVPGPLILLGGHGAALLSVGFYHCTTHVIAALRVIRAERHATQT